MKNISVWFPTSQCFEHIYYLLQHSMPPRLLANISLLCLNEDQQEVGFPWTYTTISFGDWLSNVELRKKSSGKPQSLPRSYNVSPPWRTSSRWGIIRVHSIKTLNIITWSISKHNLKSACTVICSRLLFCYCAIILAAGTIYLTDLASTPPVNIGFKTVILHPDLGV